MKKQILFLLILGAAIQASDQTNTLRSYNINFQSMTSKKKQGKELSFRTMFGISQKARNGEGEKVSAPQYLYADQNALAMLKGMGATTKATAVGQQINVDGDNGIRGHYKVTGEFLIPVSVVLGASYHFDSEWTITANVPFYHMKFSNIDWKDQTLNVTGDDALTRTLLTNSFFSNVYQLGQNLNLQNWSQRGVGDGTVMVSWSRQFFQNKKWLKQVNVHARAGAMIPIGIKKDEDKAFSLAFGNDGAYALPFGAGLDLRFRNFAWAGVTATFEHIFSHTKTRRIMTDGAQTNYLLLQKANTRQEYGFKQAFNVYIEPTITDTLSLRCAYFHTKSGDSKLFVLSEDYSSTIANKGVWLEDGTTHDLIMQLKWNGSKSEGRFKPEGSLVAQIPFNARGSLQTSSIGLNVSVGF